MQISGDQTPMTSPTGNPNDQNSSYQDEELEDFAVSVGDGNWCGLPGEEILKTGDVEAGDVFYVAFSDLGLGVSSIFFGYGWALG